MLGKTLCLVVLVQTAAVIGGPALNVYLTGTPQARCVGRDRLGDDGAGGHKRAVADLKAGDVLLLENTRFYPGEEENDPTFAASLAALGQVYVNDAFSAAHRAHASTEGVAAIRDDLPTRPQALLVSLIR